MGIVFATRVFAQTLIDDSTYFTAPELNVLLGSAEKYSVQVQTSRVSEGDIDLSLALYSTETATGKPDSWSTIANVIDKVGISDGAVLFRSVPASDKVMGRQVRAGITLGGDGPKAYVEIWIVGRDAH